MNLLNQDIIGCDESGVGDYFGPVVFACCYISNEHRVDNKIKNLLIDSKKITDRDIVDYYNKIKDYCKYEVLVDNVYEFNKKMATIKNQNKIKVDNYYKLVEKMLNNNSELKTKEIVLDQFTTINKFNEFSQNKNKDISFKLLTKAEDSYLNVAGASIIARYHYLEEIKKIESEYNFCVLKGASSKVKDLVLECKKRFPNKWEFIIKKHFKI
ncbi:hypothetical protein [Spiroplasma endosymbiont of Aspidapion aeneum]|uniref:hypothetical protein n=1 Tax=Spiroplasma endosymbiont of Aspidapion aeneum TaxID=3066276 RepID=UPI00313BA7CF